MERFCQSCGMPMTSKEMHGTNADGSVNADYCTYCYQQGEFTEDCTMDEMIEHCVQFLDDFNEGQGTAMSPKEAIAGMKTVFPTLKRWKK